MTRGGVASVKRAVDLVVSVCGLVGLAPLLAVLAVAIKVDSAGPVFFRQNRVGRRFRPFRILKLRTMVVNAAGRSLTVAGDPRVTPVGRWLRRRKLDELPQLWNVARGDMSLVGPRPELPRYVELRRREYAIILTVRPGMTGPAALAFYDEASLLARAPDPDLEYETRVLPAKTRMAVRYVADLSLRGDARILIETLRRVICPGAGAAPASRVGDPRPS